MTTATAAAWPDVTRSRTLDGASRVYLTRLQVTTHEYKQLLDVDTAPSLLDDAPAPTFSDIGVLATLVEQVAFDIAAFQRELDELRVLLEAAHHEMFMDRPA